MARWFGRAARSDSAPSPSSLGHRRPGPLALAGHAAPPASPQAASCPGWADRAAAPALEPERLPEGWLAAAGRHHDAPGPALLRRAIEVLLAAVVLGFAAPLLAAAALAALVDRSGPVSSVSHAAAGTASPSPFTACASAPPASAGCSGSAASRTCPSSSMC